jgi:hypothetical protein
MLPDRLSPPLSAGTLLQRILEEPALVEEIRNLEASVLASLVRHVGLEDAGEIVALATPTQLTQLLDDDVWTPKGPGEKESFDARRFSLWTEILLESGPEEAARKLAGLDETFLAMALSRLIRVFDSDLLAVRYGEAADESRDPTLFERALAGSPYHEFDAYLVVARNEEGWDALIDLLTSLDANDHSLFCRLMDRCLLATEQAADEQGGFGELLMADEALSEDAAAERDERRAQRGYVEPRTAKTLLRVVARGSVEGALAETTVDPVVASYLRDVPSEPSAVRKAAAPAASRAWATPLKALLARAEPDTFVSPRKRLTASTASGGKLIPLFQALHLRDPARYDAARAELAFWANVLIAGDDSRGRTLRPYEAADEVLAVCEHGLELLSARDPGRAARVLDEAQGVALLFRLGFAKP